MWSRNLLTCFAAVCVVAVCARGPGFLGAQVTDGGKKDPGSGFFRSHSKRRSSRYQSKNRVKQARFTQKSRGAFLLPQLLDGKNSKRDGGVTPAGMIQDAPPTVPKLQPTTPVRPVPPYPGGPEIPATPDTFEPLLPDEPTNGDSDDVFDEDASESDLLLSLHATP